jgi:glycosyltransferase involved in cell wall biosynthesis
MEGVVSVVIPLYNHQHYIEESLNSVLAQGLPNIELLLLDDGSRDDGFAVACRWNERHRDRFVQTHFETQPNAGITRTIDCLIRLATGEFVLLLASDDVLLPDCISQRLRVLNDEKVSAVFGDAIPINEAGKEMGKSAISELGLKSSRAALKDPKTLFWELIFRWNVYGSGLICRRSALISESGGSALNTELYSEDMQLLYRFAAQGTLRFLDDQGALYRVHLGSTCRSAENEKKIRRNIYQSRKFALADVSGPKRWMIQLQMLTFFRSIGGVKGILLMPIVLCSYGLLWIAKFIYDLSRIHLLKQES